MFRYIKAVGAGQKRARDLDRDEARAAMRLVLDGAAAPAQVGAFLIALRMKGEAPAELAGFVDAIEERLGEGPHAPEALDVDCHGDGHEGRSSALAAAAAIAAAAGLPVVLRLDRGNAFQRHGLEASLAALGLDLSRPLDRARAAAALAAGGPAALDLATYAPELAALVALRPLLGVRTVAQTLCKLVDPMGTGARLVGVFHAPYLPASARALAALGRPGLCAQALGGLPEATPGKRLRVARPGEPEASETLTLDPPEVAPSLAPHAPSPGAAAAPAAGLDEPSPAEATRAALAGEGPLAGRAVATAALMLVAAGRHGPGAAVEAALAARARLGPSPFGPR